MSFLKEDDFFIYIALRGTLSQLKEFVMDEVAKMLMSLYANSAGYLLSLRRGCGLVQERIDDNVCMQHMVKCIQVPKPKSF